MADSSVINPEQKKNITPTPSDLKSEQRILVSGDSHLVQITSFRLNGSNYIRWSQSDTEISMVMAWLVNLTEEDISSNYMYYTIAKELWDSVKKMYSDLGNKFQI
ncbi:uncharacterized protein DS421_5g155340 [Arachis hypogaea]|nr:uncharacterized protein DS421_5g155340 [Arachis hypogaea]